MGRFTLFIVAKRLPRQQMENLFYIVTRPPHDHSQLGYNRPAVMSSGIGNEEISRFYCTKHSWKGKYVTDLRSFRLR